MSYMTPVKANTFLFVCELPIVKHIEFSKLSTKQLNKLKAILPYSGYTVKKYGNKTSVEYFYNYLVMKSKQSPKLM